MKRALLSISKTFPVTHKRAGDPTDFEGKINRNEKIHTIRKDDVGFWEKRFVKIIEGAMCLVLKEWTGRPYNSVQRDLTQRTIEDGIGLQKIEMIYSGGAIIMAKVDDRPIDPAIIANNDGLSPEDFAEWFFHGKDGSFSGKVIHFTKFRY